MKPIYSRIETCKTRLFNRTLARVVAVAFAGIVALPTFGFFGAPLTRAPNPTTDSQGRVKYIVDFAKGSSDAFPAQADEAVSRRFQAWKPIKVKNFAASIEQQYGIVAEGIIGYVGTSVVAFMNVETMERMRLDPRVILITELAPTITQSSPPWSDSHAAFPPNLSSYPMRSWGHVAVNGLTSAAASGYPYIYVVDGGAANHTDLSNVSRQTAYDDLGTPPSVVGCYPHATFVTGIINATSGNNGTIGVLPGVPVISVAITYDWWASGGTLRCGAPAISPNDIAEGLDWVYWHQRNNASNPGIVNISLNDSTTGTFAYTQTVGSKILLLATPEVGLGYTYKGAFVANSAGNNNGSACNAAYNNTQTNDGIMVVGGVDYTGDSVDGDATQGYNGNGGTYAQNVPGSNYGSCVEVWAPSKAIWGAWGAKNGALNQNNTGTWTVESVTYGSTDAWLTLGGTSFAAPHIAAVAAHLAKTNSLTTPAAIEAAVRNTFYSASHTDQGSNTIYYAILP